MSSNFIFDLCRLCASKDFPSSQNDPLCEMTDHRHIVGLIEKYLKIEILENSSLPQKFCSECVTKLQSFDLFNKRCAEVQQMFISISNGSDIPQNYENLLEKCNTNKSTTQANVMFVDVNDEDDSNTDDFVSENVNTLDESNSSDLEDVPLAARLRKKTKLTKKPASDVKQTRGRQRKNLLKVPPLKIKAITTKKAVKENGNSNEEPNVTKYKIHENTSSKSIKSKSKSVDSSKSADEEDDNDYSSDECAPDNEESAEKSSKRNPFPVFEFKCTTCPDIFKNFNSLKRHCKKEHGTSAVVNCVCGKQLRARTAIVEHRRKHTGTSLYKCDTCGKTFNRRSLMCLHMISHMPKDEQPYVCCKCAKRFHTSSLLKKHEKVHLPEEERFLDVCHICQKKFTSKSAVNAHLRAVHYREKPFICEHCGNSFSSKAILTDHLTTHSTYAPWPCTVCGRNFKSKYRLNVHMDMHRSVKYRCPHCSMELSTRRTLRMHLLVHKEEKGYVCKVCSKAFRRSKDLKNHNNLHTGRRPYKCEFCERTFANGSNCRAHKLRMHPEELGVEKNTRLYTKGTKSSGQVTNSTQPAKTTQTLCEEGKEKTSQIPSTDIVEPRNLHAECATNKYEFPAITSEVEYSLECPRYSAPLNLNLKRDAFIGQPNVHLAFTTEMQPESSKMHHFLSYST